MINLRRLDLVRQDSFATADELASLQAQLNALVFLQQRTQTTVGTAGTASALPANPTGYIEFQINGVAYVLPFYAKA